MGRGDAHDPAVGESARHVAVEQSWGTLGTSDLSTWPPLGQRWTTEPLEPIPLFAMSKHLLRLTTPSPQ